MDDQPRQAQSGRCPTSTMSSAASTALLCATVLLVAGLLVTAAWLQDGSDPAPGSLPPGQTAPGQLSTAAAVLAWLLLPPAGIALAVAGMRRPRRRAAVIGLVGNAVVWVAWPVTLIVTTLVSGP